MDLAFMFIQREPLHIFLGEPQAFQEPELCCINVNLSTEDASNLQEKPFLSCIVKAETDIMHAFI